jgi:hypothetical protein
MNKLINYASEKLALGETAEANFSLKLITCQLNGITFIRKFCGQEGHLHKILFRNKFTHTCAEQDYKNKFRGP